MSIAPALIWIIQAWGVIGAAVALVFLAWGIERIDEDARGTYLFRVLIIPGVLLLWPLVLWRWWVLESESAAWISRYKPVRGAHGAAVLTMTGVIAATIVLGVNARQDWPSDIAPVLLEAPE